MKQFKLFFACALMSLLSLGQVWATEESVDVTPDNALNDGGVDPITIACAKGDGTSNPAISSGQLRLYQAGSDKTTGNTITFSSTCAITKIEFTFANSMTASNGSFSDGTYDSGTSTWTGSTNSLTLTVTGTTSGTRIYITAMKVYYEIGGGTPTCATPTFSPAAGSYEGTQNVTITSTTGSTIYYTTDGTDPKTSGTKQTYSAAVTVAADMTLKAYAVKAGSNDSEVGTAAYVITEGPDVTLNLIDGNWGFPTSNATGTETYTNSVTGYSVTCYAPTNYKVSGSSYFYLGKSGAYIELPSFSSPIEKIVVTGNSGASTGVIWNIFKGDDAVSTAATGCAEDSYTFNIAEPEANVVYTLKVTSAHNLQIKAIKIYYGAAPAVAKPAISGDESFLTSTTVTMSCATDGAAIYYTTTESAKATPATSGDWAAYNGSSKPSFSATTTVWAAAKVGNDWSAVAEKTFTKVVPLTTMAEVQAAATTTTDQTINVTINNWVVTAVSGSQVWFTDADNTKGILLYKSSHEFTVGKKLNGTVLGTKIKLYNLYPELTSLVASEVTVTDATAITPRTTTIAALTSGHPAEQGTVVKLEDVTYSSSDAALSDGVNTIAADNKFFSSLALVDGTTYDITGVVTYYKNGDDAVVKIAPRAATDVEAKSAVVIPTAANLAALKAAERGTYILTLTNAVVSYVNGNNAFIEDATGGALIYFASHGYSAGDCLNGDYQVVTTDYQGKFEITAMEPQAGAATTTAEIPLTTVSIATLNADFAAYESKRIKIAGANVTDAISGSDRNGAINDGAALAVYAAVASTITLTANDNVDIIGYPGFHNTDQQLNVWRQEDITVNEKDPAGIAFTPESETITDGDPWSAPAFANPNNLDVTFGTSNDEVATVSNTGVVSLEGGYGTAVITAHTDGDATHNAGNATYTITVNDPSSVDTRSIANGPAAFTTTSGFLTPNDILFISHKGNASTAPSIYNDGIRLYQISGTSAYGGYVTLIAKKGCKIDQVQITTTNTYATSVGYYVDADETSISGEEAVAKSGTYSTATGLDADSVRILNLGTGSKGRLEIASITVYYTGTAAAVNHYELGGTYQTDFEIGDAFNHDGLEVYMAFDAASTEKIDLTAGCTFSEPDMTAAGAPTVEISFGTTAITSYDITVAASTLLDPELSYDPTSATLTQGDALSAPKLNNPHTLDLTFASNKKAVADVDEFGEITLTGGTGTAVITASFAGDATYQAGSATFTITVNEPAEDLSGTWKFATSVEAGDRIIIASIADAGAVTTMGAQASSNRSGVASTVDGTVLTPATGTKSVTLVDAGEGKFALQLNNGSYLYASSNSSNQLKETTAYASNDNAKWTIAFDGEGVATITAQGTNEHNVMRYNPNSGSPLFACYANNSTTGTLVTIYKKETPTKDLIRGGLSNGKWGTICPKQTVEDVEGAVFYQISYLEEKNDLPYNVVFDEISGTTLEAGKPYIFIANATEIRGNKTGAVLDAAGAGVNGLYGYIGATSMELTTWHTDYDKTEDNTFIIYNNSVMRINQGGTMLKSERCYININALEPSRTPVNSAPGRRRIIVGVSGTDTATGISNTEVSEAPRKVMIDGSIYILRGENIYDATGRLVK